MKIKDLIDDKFINSLEILAKSTVSIETAYKILDIKDKVISGTDKFLTLRKTLIERFGKKDDQGAMMVDREKAEYVIDDQEGFNKSYDELLSLDIEIPSISKADLKEVRISADQLRPLRVIITG